MMSFKWPLILICLFTLVGCQPKGEEAAGFFSSTVPPLIIPMILSTEGEPVILVERPAVLGA